MSNKKEVSWAVIILVLIGMIFLCLLPSMILIVVLNYFFDVFGGVYHIPFNIWSILAVAFIWSVVIGIFKRTKQD